MLDLDKKTFEDEVLKQTDMYSLTFTVTDVYRARL